MYTSVARLMPSLLVRSVWRLHVPIFDSANGMLWVLAIMKSASAIICADLKNSLDIQNASRWVLSPSRTISHAATHSVPGTAPEWCSHAIAGSQCLTLSRAQSSIRAFHSIYFASPSCPSHGNFLDNILQLRPRRGSVVRAPYLAKRKYPRLGCRGLPALVRFITWLLENYWYTSFWFFTKPRPFRFERSHRALWGLLAKLTPS
jgi:hypothetical protein